MYRCHAHFHLRLTKCFDINNLTNHDSFLLTNKIMYFFLILSFFINSVTSYVVSITTVT